MKDKKYKKHIATVFNCFLFVSCAILLTGCNKSDELDTNQLSGSEVTLKSFGPSPIVRGAELRIIGTNLDKVESVTIPGATPITGMNRISKTEIRVTVPQTAEEGFISLKVGDKIITSVTKISYSEPIKILSFTPAKVKPGDATLKIEGEYLNLIREVIFVNADLKDNHVLQADFISQSREAIVLPVPRTAQTGKIIVSNGADLVEKGKEPGIPIWVYSENDLTVSTPAFADVSPEPVKPGNELIITGTNLDLVEFLRFGNSNIEVIPLEQTAEIITAIVPKETQIDATTGKGDLKLVAFSGVEITYGDLRLIAPVITGISPEPAKNKGTLTIEGTDLDLVTAIIFAGDVAGEINDENSTDVKIEVTVPATAVDGKLVLNTHSGQTAEMDYTLIRPVISNLDPLSLTAGDDLTIKGNNLDLVVEVIFKSGEKTVSVNLTDPNSASFTVRTPFTATDGNIVLKTTNGTEIASSQSLKIKEATLPIVTDMPIGIRPLGLLTLKGVNFETVTKVSFMYPLGEKAATQFLSDISGETLQMYVPVEEGVVKIRLYAGYDHVEYGDLIILLNDPVWDESYVFFDFDNKSKWWGSYGSIDNNPELSLDGSSYFRINENLPEGWVDFFWRNGRNDFKTNDVTVADWVIKIDVNVLGPTTPPFKFRLKGSNIGDYWLIFGGLENKGVWYTVILPLADFADKDGLGSNYLPNIQDIDQDFGLALEGAGLTNICIDNVRFERK